MLTFLGQKPKGRHSFIQIISSKSIIKNNTRLILFSSLYEFFIGNIPTMEQMEADKKIFHDYVLEWHNQYGQVIKYQILDTIIVSTIEPESIKVIREFIVFLEKRI